MGDDKDIKVIEIPDDWIMPKPDKTKKDPAFDKSDNPGVQDSYSYHSVFEIKGKAKKTYTCNVLPTGYIPMKGDKYGL